MGQDQDQKTTPNDIAIDDDYVSRLPKGSKSARAAAEGDREAVEEYRESEFRLPPIFMDSEHARQKAQDFEGGAQSYNEHGGSTKNEPFLEMMAQAADYRRDAANIDRSNDLYATFLPESHLAFDSVVRFKAIQDELQVYAVDNQEYQPGASDMESWFGAGGKTLGGTQSGKTLGETRGTVGGASDNLAEAQGTLITALDGMRAYGTRKLIRELEQKKQSAQDNKKEIEDAISGVTGTIGLIDKALGFGGTGAKSVSVNNVPDDSHPEVIRDPNGMGQVAGNLGTAGTVGGVVGTVADVGMQMLHGDELRKLDAQINTLTAQIQAADVEADNEEFQKITGDLKNAVHGYLSKVTQYEEAIANRRAQYADVGHDADVAAHHGREPKEGEDTASQMMLFISAARETDAILNTAITTGRTAEQQLSTTRAGMAHRERSTEVANFDVARPEGRNAPDDVAVARAHDLTRKWVAGTETELHAFDKIEETARAALKDLAKAPGRY